jgi:hypothetical protein
MKYDTFGKIQTYFENIDTKQAKVFKLLKDLKWHCRECEGKKLSLGQYAGGGGIQGLERGTKSRAGLKIEEVVRECDICIRKTKQDRLTGRVQVSNAPSGISPKLIIRVLESYEYTDVIEERKREAHKLVVDHRMPMERWGIAEEINKTDMSIDDIHRKFQVLKKDDGGNHNLLKSRSCEKCIKTGMRGYPLGIKYWYKGNEKWSKNIPKVGKEAEKGCVGCGWYDFKTWRESLNSFLIKR